MKLRYINENKLPPRTYKIDPTYEYFPDAMESLETQVVYTLLKIKGLQQLSLSLQICYYTPNISKVFSPYNLPNCEPTINIEF